MDDKLCSQDSILALEEKLPWQHCNFACEIIKAMLRFWAKIIVDMTVGRKSYPSFFYLFPPREIQGDIEGNGAGEVLMTLVSSNRKIIL